MAPIVPPLFAGTVGRFDDKRRKLSNPQFCYRIASYFYLRRTRSDSHSFTNNNLSLIGYGGESVPKLVSEE